MLCADHWAPGPTAHTLQLPTGLTCANKATPNSGWGVSCANYGASWWKERAWADLVLSCSDGDSLPPSGFPALTSQASLTRWNILGCSPSSDDRNSHTNLR